MTSSNRDVDYHTLLNSQTQKGVEYVEIEEPQNSGGWGEQLLYHTGTAFIAGGAGAGLTALIPAWYQYSRSFTRKVGRLTVAAIYTKSVLPTANTAAAVMCSYHLIRKSISLGLRSDDSLSAYSLAGGIVGALLGASPKSKLPYPKTMSGVIGLAAGFLLGLMTERRPFHFKTYLKERAEKKKKAELKEQEQQSS
eukprot:TRINITY_DN423_c0_g1_i1.p1 TRINITY_DN423_c0_g1~~TRINITY_DN423_c0_g1_i1.p1  ORF type:complete len:195 (+),score=25.60 TRINITY_DN423_c0_g1_i1:223-807(+)